MVKRFGGPEVLELVELAMPAPAAGEFRIAVSVVSLGWMDTVIRAGNGPAVFTVDPPYVPGSGVAGTVQAVGAGVDSSWLGVRVLARGGGGYGGGYADTVIGTPETVYRVPQGLDLHSAMAVLDDGSTAAALLEATPVRQGECVLVAPGVGGLGNLLVQLLLQAGAEVIAAVRGTAKLDVARGLGAEAVDYSTPDWPDQVRELTGTSWTRDSARSATRPDGLDVVFDGIGGTIGAVAATLLRDGGRFSGYGMSSGAETVIDQPDKRVSVVGMSQLPGFWADSPRRVRHVLDETAAGRLSPIIGRTYPLEAAATAHADIEARQFIGKSLLVI